MSEWQPIETAPRDESSPILVWFDHAADPYNDPAILGRLTDYAAIAEGGDFLTGEGVALVVWRDGYNDTDGWESTSFVWMPGGWFVWINGDAGDQVANAISWMPLPAKPLTSNKEGTQ